MDIKSQKGITTIDVTISIIIITLFVALIATLMYMIRSNSNTIERKAEATNYAINTIEEIKAANFEEAENLAGEGNIGDTGYYKKVTITDYADLPENQGDSTILPGLVKKVTVEISYQNGNTTETVDLSTVITKND